MTVMASGSAAAFAKAQPVLDAIGGKVWRLGEAAGVGSTVKMVNQLLAGVHIAAAAEAMALGIRAGADPQTLYDVITTVGRQLLDVPEPGAAHPRRRRHAAVGGRTSSSRTSASCSTRRARSPSRCRWRRRRTSCSWPPRPHGDGAKDDAFVIRFWQALAGIDLPGKVAGKVAG